MSGYSTIDRRGILSMIEVYTECENADVKIEDIIKKASQFALEYMKKDGNISVIIVDNAEIHRLNLEHRNVDSPTDVLSFPANEGESIAAIPDGFLGDIVISFERAKEQACEYGHSIEREAAFLAVHGTLHLLGYDHMNEDDEKEMFALQKEILEGMGVRR